MNEAEIAARHNVPGDLIFVKWDHTATPGSNELTVRTGDEVTIITCPKEDDETGWYKVKHTVTGETVTGNIPKSCFYRRRKVNFCYTGQELSVDEDEIVGIISEDTGDDMCQVMKENGTKGKIPVGCFSASYEDHIAEELYVNKIDKNRDDGNLKGYFTNETGLVPSKRFEPPIKAEIAARHDYPEGLKFVRWDHTAAPNSNELTVQKGEEVIIISRPKEDDEAGWYKVKHTVTKEIGNIPKSCFYTRMKVKFCFTGQALSVDEDEIVGIINEDTEDDMWLVMKENREEGKIPVRCFYTTYKAYGNHITAKSGELSVNKGDNIGIIDKSRDDGYWMGYFRGRTGLVRSKCFEVPIKVIVDYESTDPKELSVKKGDEVSVMDAIANVQVRRGHKIGHIPLKCVITEAAKNGRLQSEKGISKTEKEQDVDNGALNNPLAIQDSEDVIDYIKDLKAGQIIALGLSLGLSYETLTSIKCEDIPSEMVTAWLSRKDYVMKTSGDPSWKSLKEALLEIGVTDVANMIMKDNTRFHMDMMVNLQWNDEISILKEAGNKWDTIASHLGINKAAVEEEYRTINDRFQKVLETWIETGGNNDYPATWMGLKKMLNACELDMCTQKIKDAMKLLDI